MTPKMTLMSTSYAPNFTTDENGESFCSLEEICTYFVNDAKLRDEIKWIHSPFANRSAIRNRIRDELGISKFYRLIVKNDDVVVSVYNGAYNRLTPYDIDGSKTVEDVFYWMDNTKMMMIVCVGNGALLCPDYGAIIGDSEFDNMTVVDAFIVPDYTKRAKEIIIVRVNGGKNNV